MSSTLAELNILFVDNEHALQEVGAMASDARWVVLDTEFEHTRTFYPRLGLIQCVFSSCPDKQYLVDTVALGAQAVAEIGKIDKVLLDPAVPKVLHACSEDVTALMQYFGWQKKCETKITNLLDTQIAAAYLGFGHQVGYRELVKVMCDVELSKEETRSDWLQRPLTESQMAYAARDVQYLSPCYHQMITTLENNGRLDWAIEDSERHVQSQQHEEALDRYYLKFQQGWQLDHQQVSLLKDLCTWREETARTIDTPRTRIIRDGCLYEIAEKQPSDMRGLMRLKSLKGRPKDIRYMKRYADQILNRISVIDDADAEEDAAIEPIEKPLDRDLKMVFKECKEVLARVAETIKVPQERLLAKKDLHRFIASYAHHVSTNDVLQLPSIMIGWRHAFIYEPLTAVLVGYKQQLIAQYSKRSELKNRWNETSQHR